MIFLNVMYFSGQMEDDHLKLSVKLCSWAQPPRNNVAVLSSEGDGEEASRAHCPLPVRLLAGKVIPEYKSINWVG